MAGAALLSARRAVRRLLTEATGAGHLTSGRLAVAVSGGADSLALAAAARHVTERAGLRLHGLIVDHRLQADSAQVAESAATRLRTLGLDEVAVLPVSVTGPGGVEAAARRARYAALRSALPTPDALILLGHTVDDQAESVLLGLGRGSGARSIAGMRPLDPPWVRPFLGLRRADTVAICAELGLAPWSDPHNDDPAFTRVRLRREVLPLLETVLQGGVTDALARTAAQLREDNDALDELAARVLQGSADELEVTVLAEAPAAVRRRALRAWLLAAGVRELTDAHLRAVDELISAWRGQGGVWLPGGLEAARAHGRLRVSVQGRNEG